MARDHALHRRRDLDGELVIPTIKTREECNEILRNNHQLLGVLFDLDLLPEQIGQSDHLNTARYRTIVSLWAEIERRSAVIHKLTPEQRKAFDL